MHRRILSHCAIACLLVLNACSASNAATVAPTAAPFSLTTLPDAALRVLVARDAIDPDVYDGFTQASGIQVVEQTYASDADLIDATRLAQADLVVASERTASALHDRWSPVDAALLPNAHGVDTRLMRLFDPSDRTCVPLLWGTVGLLFRTDLAGAEATWGVLWDAQRAPKVALLDEPRLAIGAGLKWLGLSLNSRSSADLQRASDLMSRQRGATRIDSAAWSDALLTGAVVVAQARSNDAAFAQSANANLRFVVPREGAPLWMECMLVPTTAQQSVHALAFANYLLRPDVSAQNSAYTYSLSSVPEAYNRMEPGVAALFRSGYVPDDETLLRSEFVRDVGALQTEYERIWNDLKR